MPMRRPPVRNMSFALTTAQILNRSKTVTRRIGWTFLKPGDRLCAIEKGQGLKKGEKVKRLAVIEVTAVAQQPLNRLLEADHYAHVEVQREGFPQMTPREFVDFFCGSHRIDGRPCTPDDTVTRIEFKYVEDADRG